MTRSAQQRTAARTAAGLCVLAVLAPAPAHATTTQVVSHAVTAATAVAWPRAVVPALRSTAQVPPAPVSTGEERAVSADAVPTDATPSRTGALVTITASALALAVGLARRSRKHS